VPAAAGQVGAGPGQGGGQVFAVVEKGVVEGIEKNRQARFVVHAQTVLQTVAPFVVLD
jgi:hypothetical protein